MASTISVGICQFCAGTFGRAAMTRHLFRCGQPAHSPATLAADNAKTDFHVVVEGHYAKSYWLHLAVPARAPLGMLDSFLRGIWLECCGHLSAFSIAGSRYAYQPMSELRERGLRVPLHGLVDVGAKFAYEYDYGSTTELDLRIVGRRERVGERRDIQLLARNAAPQIACDECGTGAPATRICTDCAWSGKGWLCDNCASAHKCGSDMFLPVVNSPRVGVCGYTG